MSDRDRYEELRTKHRRDFQALLPEYQARIYWTAEQLAEERQARLRELLATAKERSPWHAARLAHITPETFTEADLSSLSTMTKNDLMANFDGIVTDSRLSLAVAQRHLEGLEDDDYLFDEFHVAASGGSSGMRGVFIYDWDAFTVWGLTTRRFQIRSIRSDPLIQPDSPVVQIMAGNATHLSYATIRTLGADSLNQIAASAPVSEIVARLNAVQPVFMTAYPSMLYVLANEALAGRLDVKPVLVGVSAEPLLPEIRESVKAAWGATLVNIWGSSEGPTAGSCGIGTGLHLNEDVCIFEFADVADNLVTSGQAAKIYVTNLYNRTLPLIRYEITDEVLLLDGVCPCGCSMRRIDDVQGRHDDVFHYAGGVVVHPIAFRSPLGHEPAVVEYQVRQTPRGADVAVRLQSQLHTADLARAIEASLGGAGLTSPAVTVSIVQGFERPHAGKLKRFFPLD